MVNVYCIVATHIHICYIIVVRKWEQFNGAAPRFSRDSVRAAMNPSAEITFDVETYRRMGEPQAVVLLYEVSTETIGIKPANVNEVSAYLVRKHSTRSTRVVRSRAFFRNHGIEPVTTMVFTSAYLEEDILVLDLRNTVAYGKHWKSLKQDAAKREAAAEARAERERVKQERASEKLKLRDEREALRRENQRLKSIERQLAARDRELKRARLDLERDHPTDNDQSPIDPHAKQNRPGGLHFF